MSAKSKPRLHWTKAMKQELMTVPAEAESITQHLKNIAKKYDTTPSNVSNKYYTLKKLQGKITVPTPVPVRRTTTVPTTTNDVIVVDGVKLEVPGRKLTINGVLITW